MAQFLAADIEQEIQIPSGSAKLGATLAAPHGANRIVIFVHGSGSSRFSPRNNFVAGALRSRGAGTLLMDLLTPSEDQSRNNRFDIDLLVERLVSAGRWVKQ